MLQIYRVTECGPSESSSENSSVSCCEVPLAQSRGRPQQKCCTVCSETSSVPLFLSSRIPHAWSCTPAGSMQQHVPESACSLQAFLGTCRPHVKSLNYIQDKDIIKFYQHLEILPVSGWYAITFQSIHRQIWWLICTSYQCKLCYSCVSHYHRTTTT